MINILLEILGPLVGVVLGAILAYPLRRICNPTQLNIRIFNPPSIETRLAERWL